MEQGCCYSSLHTAAQGGEGRERDCFCRALSCHPVSLGVAISLSFPPSGPWEFWWGKVLGPGSETLLRMRVLGVSGNELHCPEDQMTIGIESWVPYLLYPLWAQRGWDAPGVVWKFLNW